MSLRKTGLVLGKFMPLHKGHELLLAFANHFVDTLYVVVDNLPDAPISGALRCQWIKESFPDVTVYYIPSPNPQHPDEHPDFWNIWKRSLLALLPEHPDYLFASDDYGLALAAVLGATFIPFDLQRQIVPVSGTAIREAPFDHWDTLSDCAKRFYLKRICIFGPESSGKTTLACLLADHYKTTWVPEYARLFIESHHAIKKEDMLPIAQGQMALEKAIEPLANRLLFCDTDSLSTLLWSQWLFGEISEAIVNMASEKTYDLYLLMKPDLEWQDDPVRYFPGIRDEFFTDCVDILTRYHRKFVIVSGTGEARLHGAINHIDEFLSCLE